MNILERKEEIAILQNFLNSRNAEFLAIYGRRRVGKTFLIKNFFNQQKCVFIQITGIEKGIFLEQREECCKQISKVFYNGVSLETPSSWLKIFDLLNKAIINLPKNSKVVIFFDEFPWLATPRSRLLSALEYYWNQYWSTDPKIKLIVCGSLSSWIIRNIINNTGGLYNRVTYRLKLEPFNLYETKEFLNIKGIELNNKQILSIYMVTGGIPLYLEQIKKGLSAFQVIDSMCFSKNGLLVDELKELFKSLFQDSNTYLKMMREIAKHRHGISKVDLAKQLGVAQSGRFLERLQELEDAGFIISFLPYQHVEKGVFFRVIDEYTLFYFHWIEPHLKSIRQFKKTTGFWTQQALSSSYKAWSGYTFESICYKHIAQIMKKLKLKSTSIPFSWKYTPSPGSNEQGAQIDLLFDRDDQAITLFEMKYTEQPFIIDKQYCDNLRRKMAVFKERTKTSKQIFWCIVSASGLKKNMYSEALVSETVDIDDLFKADE